MRKLIVLVTGLLALITGAQAADNGIYIGAGIGQSTVELDDIDTGTTTSDFKGEDLGYKVIVGIRPLDWIAFEANYVNFGEPDDTVAGNRLRSEGYGITGYAVGFLSMGPFDLFAKGGVVSWDAELDDPQFPRESDGTDLAYGAGVQFRFLSLGVRAEYEIFDIDDLDEANMISVGVTYTFL